jgi:hypothetical protein
MKNAEQWKSALRVALKCTNANALEISTAMESISKNSPIAGVRVVRALANASAHGGLDSLNESDRGLVLSVLGEAS